MILTLFFMTANMWRDTHYIGIKITFYSRWKLSDREIVKQYSYQSILSVINMHDEILKSDNERSNRHEDMLNATGGE